MRKKHASPLSRADMQAMLASRKRRLYQLEVDHAMGLFENEDPKEYESLVASMQEEIRALEDRLQQGPQ